MSWIGSILRFFMERGAKRKSLDELITALQEGETAVLARMNGAADTSRNRDVARHVIMIERWGQRRMRTLLGEPLLQDESDAYAPDPALTMGQLQEAFAKTRSETIALANELKAAGIAKSRTVFHNDAGEMSLGAWLVYLRGHAMREAGAIK